MCAKLIHAVVLLQMLFHSICGCCWHHSHSLSGAVCQHSEVAETKHHSCRHHTHHGQRTNEKQPESDSTPTPHPEAPCDEERCQFVTVEPTQISELGLRWYDAQESADLVRQNELVITANFQSLYHESSGLPLTSVERCALYQAWLI